MAVLALRPKYGGGSTAGRPPGSCGAARPPSVMGPVPLGTTALKGQPCRGTRSRECATVLVHALCFMTCGYLLLSFAPAAPARAQEWRSAEFARGELPRQWQPGAASSWSWERRFFILLGLARGIISWTTHVDGCTSRVRVQRIQALGGRSGTLAVQCYRQLGNGRHTGHLATTEHVPRPCKDTTCSGASEGGHHAVASPRRTTSTGRIASRLPARHVRTSDH